MSLKNISILGSTGSIGVSTLDIVARHPDRFKVCALAAGSNIELLARQIRIFSPEIVSVKSDEEALKLKKILGSFKVEIVHGIEGASLVATHNRVDIVVSAIVGAAGLIPTLAAIQKGIPIALANKESMVIAGELLRKEANRAGSIIIPVDSEHSALFQCLHGNRREDLKSLILTASGGPFLNKPVDEFKEITVADALKHPNWSMGDKITIDSATMMNKGLEVMEARWLFDVPLDIIRICVHPESIIHSMVEYVDGSVMAQMGVPDMKIPIAYALTYPERIETGARLLDLFEINHLRFLKPDFEKFKSLKLAYDVAHKGQTYPAVLNAANEISVWAFLKKKINFQEIFSVNDDTVNAHKPFPLMNLDDILQADGWAREYASKLIKALLK